MTTRHSPSWIVVPPTLPTSSITIELPPRPMPTTTHTHTPSRLLFANLYAKPFPILPPFPHLHISPHPHCPAHLRMSHQPLPPSPTPPPPPLYPLLPQPHHPRPHTQAILNTQGHSKNSGQIFPPAIHQHFGLQTPSTESSNHHCLLDSFDPLDTCCTSTAPPGRWAQTPWQACLHHRPTTLSPSSTSRSMGAPSSDQLQY